MLSETLLTYFVNHLGNTHGSPPNDMTAEAWADEMALRLEGMRVTQQQAHAAAEFIITRKAIKTFPPMATCLAAIKDAVAGGTLPVIAAGSRSTASGDILARFRAYRAAHGRPWVVIQCDSAEWHDWRAYFERIGQKTVIFDVLADVNKPFQAPTVHPREFDPSCPIVLARSGTEALTLKRSA